MSPISDECAVTSLRNSLERHCGHDLPDCHYFWEVTDSIAWHDDAVIADWFCDAEYYVIFDPNPWTMLARMAAARHAGLSDAALGYRVTRDELKDLLRQTWMTCEDYYVIDAIGQLRGLRTHEDPDSQRGIWIPAIST